MHPYPFLALVNYQNMGIIKLHPDSRNWPEGQQEKIALVLRFWKVVNLYTASSLSDNYAD
jgi:hypothetical protein